MHFIVYRSKKHNAYQYVCYNSMLLYWYVYYTGMYTTIVGQVCYFFRYPYNNSVPHGKFQLLTRRRNCLITSYLSRLRITVELKQCVPYC